VVEPRIVKAGAERVDELEPLWLALHEHQTSVDPGIEGIPPRPLDQTWPLRRANYLHWLHDDPDAFVLIAETADAYPIAYALVSIDVADDTHVTGERIAELQTLSVLPSHRNAGLGTRMMEAVFAELRSLGIRELVIAMITTNEPARRFYERFGFHPWLVVALGKVPEPKESITD
jgi:ribosomal protein S18 acetylase RimI-like enzyme